MQRSHEIFTRSKAGIQNFPTEFGRPSVGTNLLDSRLRGNDGKWKAERVLSGDTNAGWKPALPGVLCTTARMPARTPGAGPGFLHTLFRGNREKMGMSVNIDGSGIVPSRDRRIARPRSGRKPRNSNGIFRDGHRRRRVARRSWRGMTGPCPLSPTRRPRPPGAPPTPRVNPQGIVAVPAPGIFTGAERRDAFDAGE